MGRARVDQILNDLGLFELELSGEVGLVFRCQQLLGFDEGIPLDSLSLIAVGVDLLRGLFRTISNLPHFVLEMVHGVSRPGGRIKQTNDKLIVIHADGAKINSLDFELVGSVERGPW
jgi:hypothetical protein